MSQKRMWFYILVVLPAVGMTAIGSLAYFKFLMPLYGGRWLPKDGKVLPPAGSVAFQPHQQRMNILVLGIDYNHDRRGMIYTKGARSDTMMVVSLNRKGQFLNVVSIPRDTYVQISEHLGYDKINAAYSYGGARQAMRTVGRFLGVPIHHYVAIKVHGAKSVLDALGGLTIDVEKKMDYDDNWGNLHIHLKKGRQTLNGEQAVGYARFRMDEEGDRGRMRRQQQVIRALVAKLKSPSTVGRIPALARAVKQTLQTDLTLAEMIDLAHLYKSFDPKRVRAAQVVGDDDTVGGAWVIVPYQPENQRIVRRLLKDSADLALHEIRVRVKNGCKDHATAVRLADQLHLQGFRVVDIEDCPKAARTEVLEHVKSPRSHQRLQALLNGARFRTSQPNAKYDVTVVLGTDLLRPTYVYSGNRAL